MTSSTLSTFTKKSLAVLLAGSTVYYLINSSSSNGSNNKIIQIERKINEKIPSQQSKNNPQLHAETDTQPTPPPITDQPGNLTNTESSSSS
ncbi:unnamed protein product [Cunninghamella blakesleeana]